MQIGSKKYPFIKSPFKRGQCELFKKKIGAGSYDESKENIIEKKGIKSVFGETP